MTCPTCESHDRFKNDTTRRGKPNYQYRGGNRQFVEAPQLPSIP